MEADKADKKPIEPKYKDWILETIDHLRKRKARPDLERICHMVSRKHGVSSADITANLDQMVQAEIVIKVDYKGSTSYRNAAKWKKNLPGNTLSSVDASRRLQAAIKAVENRAKGQDPAVEVVRGATAAQLEGWLDSQPDSPSCLTKTNLQSFIDRDVEAGRLQQVSPGRYAVISPPKTPKSKPKSSPGGSTTKNNNNNPSSGNKPQSAPAPKAGPASPSKKGRPAAKRKRFKKNLWPGFVDVVKQPRLEKEVEAAEEKTEPPPLPPKQGRPPTPQEPTMEDDDKCDYCLQTKACNRKGQPEDLLICKDCRAKAHPSCMDYSDDLAKRARKSPWQCIDCKTCYVCEDSGDPDSMLFCDACDKGYHMNCHNPPIKEKPTGKWVCNQCMLELGLSEEELMDTDESPEKAENEAQNTDGGGPSCLPTPSDSPVQFPNSPEDTSSEGPEPEPERKEKEKKVEKQEKKDPLTLKIRIKKDKDTEKPKKESSKFKMNGHVSQPGSYSLPRLADTLPAEVPDASNWTIDDVVNFFLSVGFLDQAEVFREQEIDGKSLLLMKRNDVLTGLSLKLGPALKIYTHVQRLQTRGLSPH